MTCITLFIRVLFLFLLNQEIQWDLYNKQRIILHAFQIMHFDQGLLFHSAIQIFFLLIYLHRFQVQLVKWYKIQVLRLIYQLNESEQIKYLLIVFLAHHYKKKKLIYQKDTFFKIKYFTVLLQHLNKNRSLVTICFVVLIETLLMHEFYRLRSYHD